MSCIAKLTIAPYVKSEYGWHCSQFEDLAQSAGVFFFLFYKPRDCLELKSLRITGVVKVFFNLYDQESIIYFIIILILYQ